MDINGLSALTLALATNHNYIAITVGYTSTNHIPPKLLMQIPSFLFKNSNLYCLSGAYFFISVKSMSLDYNP